jgi:hypothetical protein
MAECAAYQVAWLMGDVGRSCPLSSCNAFISRPSGQASDYLSPEVHVIATYSVT